MPPLSVSAPVITEIDSHRYFLGDFDGNALTDIYYVGGLGNSTGTLYLNAGAGYRAVPGILHSLGASLTEAQKSLLKIRVADMNGDGLSDLFVTSDDGLHIIYLSKGDGTFNFTTGPSFALPSYPLSQLSQSLHRIQLADVDGDGLMDVFNMLGGDNGTVQVEIYVQRFTVWEKRNGPQIPLFGRSGTSLFTAALSTIKIGDINGDQLADIFVVKGWRRREACEVYLNMVRN